MKLLFDQNLSRRLVAMLAEEFPGSAHVVSLGLDTSTDREVWEFAGENDFVVVSKDSDFRQLAFLLGPPPKVVWLRLGNCTTATITNTLRSHLGSIARFVAEEQEALLVLPDLGD
jgi:predicted nuclease of predicted toxin-antitoxin system